MIGIIDYNAGNLYSVKKALDFIGAENRILCQAEEFKEADRLILPGVGAFEPAMRAIRDRGLFDAIKAWLECGKPFLGICLGMQLLMEKSAESPGVEGLGFFKGSVEKFQGKKVPQIGWNQVRFVKDTPLTRGLGSDDFFYFLHGFYIQPEMEEIAAAMTEYGVAYPSIIQMDRISAVQFHPEKSSHAGLQLLKNWVSRC